MEFHRTHLCCQHLDQEGKMTSIEASLLCPLQVSSCPCPKGIHHPDLQQHKLILPVLEFYVNGIVYDLFKNIFSFAHHFICEIHL